MCFYIAEICIDNLDYYYKHASIVINVCRKMITRIHSENVITNEIIILISCLLLYSKANILYN